MPKRNGNGGIREGGRKKIAQKRSERDFSQAAGVHPKNLARGNPMRGGIRL